MIDVIGCPEHMLQVPGIHQGNLLIVLRELGMSLSPEGRLLILGVE